MYTNNTFYNTDIHIKIHIK